MRDVVEEAREYDIVGEFIKWSVKKSASDTRPQTESWKRAILRTDSNREDKNTKIETRKHKEKSLNYVKDILTEQHIEKLYSK